MLISRLPRLVIETVSDVASLIAALNVVVIPAYGAIILPERFSLSTVTLPSLDVTPSLKANNVPFTPGATVPTPSLTEKVVRPTFSVTTKSPT